MSALVVEVCRVDDIISHPNANALDLITIKGWQCVEKKGRYKIGDNVIFIPPDSIIPKELSDKLNCTQYLTNQRLKATRLRGIVSCGLIAPNEYNWEIGKDVAEYYGITKYEQPEPNHIRLGGQNVKEVGPFHHYTDIANWNNWNNVLIQDEEVVICEKLHGTNIRFGLIDDEFFVGSHHRNKAKDEKNVYWEVALRYNIEEKMRKLPKSRFWVIFGEAFGKKVQDLVYGLNDIELRVFDISYNGSYLDYDEFEKLAKIMQIPVVPLMYRGPYNPNILIELSQGQAFQGEHIKEGAVIRPINERRHSKLHRVILKKINPEYLVRKKGSEFH